MRNLPRSCVLKWRPFAMTPRNKITTNFKFAHAAGMQSCVLPNLPRVSVHRCNIRLLWRWDVVDNVGYSSPVLPHNGTHQHRTGHVQGIVGTGRHVRLFHLCQGQCAVNYGSCRHHRRVIWRYPLFDLRMKRHVTLISLKVWNFANSGNKYIFVVSEQHTGCCNCLHVCKGTPWCDVLKGIATETLVIHTLHEYVCAWVVYIIL